VAIGSNGSDDSELAFALVGRPRALRLAADGLHHPRTPRGRGYAFTRYEDIQHLASSPRALWIGTRHSVYLIARKRFVDPQGPEHLVRALLARIAERPGGVAQLTRMAEIEQLSHRPVSLRATYGLAIACLVGTALQLILGNDVSAVGTYSPPLVADGDWWRLFTANLLHAYPKVPIHLTLNLLGLLAIGTLVERAIGTARTLCVIGTAALGSMWLSGLRSDVGVVGVSGVLFGLLGALVWLELTRGAQLPAWWRLPRRTILGVLALSVVLGFLVPMIAGAAHLGGFVAGVLAAIAVGSGQRNERVSPVWVRAVAGAFLVATAAAISAAGFALARPGDYGAQQIARLARLPDISAGELNNWAWSVAVDPKSSREDLESALLLAERAAEETGHSESSTLDTLAELQFQLGHSDLAVQTIDEALAITTNAKYLTYYSEQRRRFLGERAADDRPEVPAFWDVLTPSESAPDGDADADAAPDVTE
jgi:membrane associated rhomboid family serine protease